jgi:hypothetical protein
MTKTYNIATIYTTIGGVQISGFGDSAGIEFEDIPLFEATDGCDGEHVVSRINKKSTTAKLTLMQTSAGYRNLAVLLNLQKTVVDAGGPITPLPLAVVDPNTGTTAISGYVTFLTEPGPKFGAKVGTVEFNLDIGNPSFVHALLMLV